MTLRICVDCSTRHRIDGPRCRPCYLAHQKARNAARPQYAGTWRAESKAARKGADRCQRCGAPFDRSRKGRSTLDHATNLVLCQTCNSSLRRNPA